MKRIQALGWVGVSALVAAYGCSVETKVIEDGAGGAGGATASTTAGPGPTTSTVATTSTGMMVADESTSCSDAVDMAELMNSAGGLFYEGKGVINPAEDKDYYKFTVKAGQWIALTTDANPMDDPSGIDTVLTLLTADGQTQLAQVDDSFPRASTDSEMFYRVEQDGTYCLEVQEFSTWAGMPAEGDPSFTYRAIMFPIDAALYDGYEEDKEPNDLVDPSGAQKMENPSVDAMTGQYFANLYGVFSPAADKDTFSFTAPAGVKAMSLYFTPSGTDGFGSTGAPGPVKVYSGQNSLIGLLDYAKGSDGISSLPITPGSTIYIQAARPAGAMAGANDSYFFKFATTDTVNPQETDDMANDTAMGAEVAMAQAGADPAATLHFLGGTLGAAGADTDWWSFEAAKNDEIVIVCSSQRAGSGVADMKVEVFSDPTKAALESETETDAADIVWSKASPDASKTSPIAPVAGTHYVKISATSMIMNGAASTHYLCGAHAITP